MCTHPLWFADDLEVSLKEFDIEVKREVVFTEEAFDKDHIVGLGMSSSTSPSNMALEEKGVQVVQVALLAHVGIRSDVP